MITVRTTEIWTANPPELIFKKLKWDTQQVKFGPFNVFKKVELRQSWVGEINEAKGTFKLFRVTSADHTSDFSIHGQYELRAGKPFIKIRHKVYFTSVLGLAGLLVFVFAFWFLLRKKGILSSEIYLLIGLLLAGGGYSFSILRDLNKNEAAIRELIERIWYDDDDENDADDDADQ